MWTRRNVDDALLRNVVCSGGGKIAPNAQEHELLVHGLVFPNTNSEDKEAEVHISIAELVSHGTCCVPLSLSPDAPTSSFPSFWWSKKGSHDLKR